MTKLIATLALILMCKGLHSQSVSPETYKPNPQDVQAAPTFSTSMGQMAFSVEPNQFVLGATTLTCHMKDMDTVDHCTIAEGHTLDEVMQQVMNSMRIQQTQSAEMYKDLEDRFAAYNKAVQAILAPYRKKHTLTSKKSAKAKP